MTTKSTLLPPAMGALKNIDLAMADRIGGIAILPIQSVTDADTCPRPLLPWLAWHYAVETWDPSAPTSKQRAAIVASQLIHARKGTRYSVQQALAAFGVGAKVVEAHQMIPAGAANTFYVSIDAPANASRPNFNLMAAAIEKTKRLSSHFVGFKIALSVDSKTKRCVFPVVRAVVKINTRNNTNRSSSYNGEFYFNGSIYFDGLVS
jgi:phage tail P2-like protein